ncbi:F-box domain-containing protein [Mycena sanguinolenta]|uniref:F-box domain-containing protein n=1 Tax=Mycena sanguinolenta TaxID=230812 RepID=A0A8H7CWU2_9AGAR|nr:F-box domain-containing protein [Mycena sanguinolenta]
MSRAVAFPAGHNIPVRLTQICSSWRMLALDTRELWSSVTLVFNLALVGKISTITKFADYWLAKGQRGKLALEIDMGVSLAPRIHDLESIGQLLTAWASDWRNLTITGCSDSVAEYVISKMAQSTYTSLEEFELHASSIVWHTRFDALAALPRLHAVNFQCRCTPAYHDLTLLLLPWSQLESVSIWVPVSGHKWLDVLKNCTELTTLELHVVCDVPAPEFRPPLVLPKLSKLRVVAPRTLWINNTSDIESFLGVLHLPMLVDFDLHLSKEDPWNPLVSPFWERHAAQLRSLQLSNPYFPVDARLLFLTVPNLMSLKLSFCESRFSAPDFDALRVEQLLPALTHLDLTTWDERGVQEIDSVRSAIAFLEARTTTTTGVARIAQVRFADWTNWDPVAMAMELQRLRALVAQGMDVQWMARRYDLLASRATSIRSPSIHSRSSRSLSFRSHMEDYSDSEPTSPTTSLVKPKRNSLR